MTTEARAGDALDALLRPLTETRPGGAALRPVLAGLSRALPDLRDPADAAGLHALLMLLHRVGRHDLPLGRLFEGHVDALQIIGRYAAPDAIEAAYAAARGGGGTLGVWNADLPGEPLRLTAGRLSGPKSYASGAGVLSHALVTADTDDGRRLVLVDLAAAPPDIDRGWWRVTGMQRSETHRVRWHDQALPPGHLIGEPGDYPREPWFSGGALRFVAVQAGGVAALFDRTRDHLVAVGRGDDPHQRTRLADLFDCAELAAAALRRPAEALFDDAPANAIARVAAARGQVAALAERALAIAQQAVGLQGLFVAHPLAAVVSDLAVYLRQPGPDAARQAVGQAAAEGRLSPAS